MAVIGIGVSPTRDALFPDIRRRNIGGYLTAEKFGDWQVSKGFFKNLPKNIKVEVYKAELEFAKLYYDKILELFNSGGWASYSENYKRYKTSKKGSELPFFQFNSNFRKVLGIQEYPKSYKVMVGISPNSTVMNSSGTLTVQEYMYIVEHGSFIRGIKKRPLFSTAFKAVGGKSTLSRLVSKRLNKALKLAAKTSIS